MTLSTDLLRAIAHGLLDVSAISAVLASPASTSWAPASRQRTLVAQAAAGAPHLFA